MREAIGDIWTYEPCDAIVIPTNGQLKGPPGEKRAVMGAGVAAECLRKVPGIDRYLGQYIELLGNRPFVLCNLMRDGHNANGPYIVSFPTKSEWRNPADLDLIAESAASLAWHTNANGWLNVVMPRVGSGLGRLPWEMIKSRLDPILDDRFVVLSEDAK